MSKQTDVLAAYAYRITEALSSKHFPHFKVKIKLKKTILFLRPVEGDNKFALLLKDKSRLRPFQFMGILDVTGTLGTSPTVYLYISRYELTTNLERMRDEFYVDMQKKFKTLHFTRGMTYNDKRVLPPGYNFFFE